MFGVPKIEEFKIAGCAVMDVKRNGCLNPWSNPRFKYTTRHVPFP